LFKTRIFTVYNGLHAEGEKSLIICVMLSDVNLHYLTFRARKQKIEQAKSDVPRYREVGVSGNGTRDEARNVTIHCADADNSSPRNSARTAAPKSK